MSHKSLQSTRGPRVSASLKNVRGAYGAIQMACFPGKLRCNTRESMVQQEFEMAITKVQASFRKTGESKSDAVLGGAAF